MVVPENPNKLKDASFDIIEERAERADSGVRDSGRMIVREEDGV